jgi:hypothetical protein
LRLGGAGLRERMAGLKKVLGAVLSTLRDQRRDSANDPVRRARKTLLSDPVRLQELEDQIEQEISHVLASALAEVPS